MDSVERLRARLEADTPPTVPFSDVERLARRYFPDGCRSGAGSHRLIVTHPALAELAFAPYGRIVFPVHRGAVKAVYVKRLLKAIRHCEARDAEAEDAE